LTENRWFSTLPGDLAASPRINLNRLDARLELLSLEQLCLEGLRLGRLSLDRLRLGRLRLERLRSERCRLCRLKLGGLSLGRLWLEQFSLEGLERLRLRRLGLNRLWILSLGWLRLGKLWLLAAEVLGNLILDSAVIMAAKRDIRQPTCQLVDQGTIRVSFAHSASDTAVLCMRSDGGKRVESPEAVGAAVLGSRVGWRLEMSDDGAGVLEGFSAHS
jgi:hypothetical protein